MIRSLLSPDSSAQHVVSANTEGIALAASLRSNLLSLW